MHQKDKDTYLLFCLKKSPLGIVSKKVQAVQHDL